jgi:ankyrin repeat protein
LFLHVFSSVAFLDLPEDQRSSLLSFGGDHDFTILHHALHLHKLEICVFLISSSALCTQLTDEGNSGLHLLCRLPNASPIYLNLISLLCKKGWQNLFSFFFPISLVGAYVANHNGELPIHTSVVWNNTDALSCLIGLGYDVNVSTKNGETSLHLAV